MNTKWKAGQRSPNPKGRPKGIADRRTKWRDTLREETPALLAKLIALAHEGEMGALLAVLDRTAPRLRPTGELVEVAGLAEAATLTEKATAVLNAVAAGTLAPDAASELLSALAATAKITETDELRLRLEKLEAAAIPSARRSRGGRHA